MKSTLSTLILSFAFSSLAQAAPAYQTPEHFKQYIENWKNPEIIFSNRRALQMRLELLDAAPKGSEVKLLTFVFDNGDSTRTLAAHACRAAQRGVKVQWITDSKSGSLPGKPNLFDNPLNEEIFQFNANCGVEHYIHNHLPEFTSRLGKIIPTNIKYTVPQGPLKQFGMMRLNHRKLAWYKSPTGEGCMLLGGRNQGDHYLAQHGIHDPQFIDGDVLLCTHHKDAKKAFADAGASFESLRTDKEVSGDLQVVVEPIKKNPNFVFEHISLATSTDYKAFGGMKTRNAEEVKAFKLSPDNKKQAAGVIPVPNDFKNEKPSGGLEMPLAYNWQLHTTTWNPKEDNVRRALYDMLQREQAEIYIESAYVEYDTKMQALVEAALKRGVDVTIVSNSLFVSDAGSKLIAITRAEWTNKMHLMYGNAVSLRSGNFPTLEEIKVRHQYVDKEGPGRFTFYVTTVYTGHMIHYKGAGFKCQKQDNGSFNKAFLIGSHNFHNRSGIHDKEHALTWNEPIDMVCINKLGQQKFTNDVVQTTLARYKKEELNNGEMAETEIQDEFADMIDRRYEFYARWGAIHMKERGAPLLYSFRSLSEELDQQHPTINDVHREPKLLDKVLSKSMKIFTDHVLYSGELDENGVPLISPTGAKVLNALQPIRDFIANFL